MANENSVNIKIKVDKTTGVAQIEQFGKKMEKSFNRAGKAAKKTSGITTAFTKSIRQLKTAVVMAAGAAGMGLLVRSFMNAANEAENYKVRLKVLLGSQAEGNRMFKEMAEFAGRVPFEYSKVMQSATQLSAVMTGGVDEVKAWMPLIADLAAATGMTLQDTTGQVQRMFSAGAASADMFRERGVLAMMGFKAGVSYSVEDTKKMMQASWNDQGSKFKGATDALAKTWSGMTSMMADAWFQFRTDVMGSGVFDGMKESLALVLVKIQELKEKGTLKEWANNIANGVLDAFKKIMLGTATMYDAIKPPMIVIGRILGTILDSFLQLPAWMQDVGLVAAFLGGKKGAAVVAAVSVAAERLGTVAKGWGLAAGGFIDFWALKDMNNEELRAAIAAFDAMNKGVENTTTSSKALWDQLDNAGSAVEKVKILIAYMENLRNASKNAANTLEKHGDAAVEAWRRMQKALETGSKEMTKAMAKQMEEVEKTIRQFGMSDYAKDVADTNKHYDDMIAALDKLTPKYQDLVDKMNQARDIDLIELGNEELAKSGDAAVKAWEEQEEKKKKIAEESADYYKQLFASALSEGDGILGKLENLFETITADLVASFVQDGMAGISASPFTKGLERAGLSASAAAGVGVAGAVGGIGWDLWQRYEEKKEATQDRREAAEAQRTMELIAALKEAANATSLLHFTGTQGGTIVSPLKSGQGMLERYGAAIGAAGQTSPVAQGAFSELTKSMEFYKMLTLDWTGEAKEFAEMWEAVYENIKKMQSETIFRQLEEGAIGFVAAMHKIENLGLDEQDLLTYQYEQSLNFLVTEGIPALYGELTKARDMLKETALEYERLQRAEEEVEIITKVLLSDLELTEEQLMGLRIGDVNLDLIELYQTLGWLDKELDVVTIGIDEAKTAFENLEEGVVALKETLDGLQSLTAGMEISDDLEKSFTSLYQNLIILEGVAISLQQLSELPDVFRDLYTAMEEGDIQGQSAAWLEFADTMIYVSTVLDQIAKTEALAKVFLGLGTFGTYVYLAYQAVMALEKGIENFAQNNDAFSDMIERWIKKLKDLKHEFPKLIAYLEGLVAEPAGTKATVRDFLGGGMTVGEAGGIYQQHAGPQYTDNWAGYAEEQKASGKEAIAVLAQERFDIYKETGDFSPEALAAFQADIKDVVDTITKGTEKQIFQKWAKAVEDFQKPFERIIAQDGMSELGIQMDNLNRYYEEQREMARDLGISLDTVNQAYAIQAKKIIEDFWQPLIDGIEDSITSLKFSDFNLGTPVEKATDATTKYEELKEAMMGAKGEDFAAAYQEYQAFTNTYLSEMQNTYMSSADYLQAFQDVMDTLGMAGDRAEGEMGVALSEYESGTWQRQDDTIAEMETIATRLESMQTQDVVNLTDYKEQQDLLSQTRDKILKDTKGTTQAIEKLGVERNEILRDMKALLKDVKLNTKESSNDGSSTQSEGIGRPFQKVG
jgi:hypothetical protein